VVLPVKQGLKLKKLSQYIRDVRKVEVVLPVKQGLKQEGFGDIRPITYS